MGYLRYDGEQFEIEDRLLAHLQVIVTLKLRRNEGFFVTWADDAGRAGGQNSIWIADGVAIRFKYAGSRRPSINREWADKLNLAANTAAGLVIGPDSIEPDELVPSA